MNPVQQAMREAVVKVEGGRVEASLTIARACRLLDELDDLGFEVVRKVTIPTPFPIYSTPTPTYRWNPYVTWSNATVPNDEAGTDERP